LGREGGTESCSGRENRRSVEAGWLAGIEDLGAPANRSGFRSEKNQSGVGVEQIKKVRIGRGQSSVTRTTSREDASADESVRNAGGANPLDNFAYVFDPKLEELVMNRMDRNSDQAVKFMENPELRSFITRLIRNQVYDRIQAEMKTRAKPQV